MTETLSYGSIRAANAVRESDEQRMENRKKSLLILVLQYLFDEGYVEAAGSLEKEASINLNRFEVCDNVNLETVLLDFESYYHVKFNRYPKIFKKLNGEKEKNVRPPGRSCPTKKPVIPSQILKKTPSLPKLNVPNGHSNNEALNPSTNYSAAGKQNTMIPKKSPPMNGHPIQEDLTLHGNFVNQNQNNSNSKNVLKGGKQLIDIRSMINDATKLPCVEENPEDKLLKPLGGYMGYSADWKELAQVISRDIYSHNPNVYWKDIIGLEDAKRLVKESVVYPIKYPQLFTGILSPWKGLLLYGPPGTGKTLLAKAVATECKTTFFNISASSIVSKWRGDSEKLVRVLFELARFHAPSTIFLDEIDAIMGQRGAAGGGEHEGSRRMKTELLVQMDGLSKSDDLVFLLAASNLPWELDPAMLRRLEKRILVDLPSLEARKAMFHSSLPPTVCSAENSAFELTADLDYDELAKLTEGYSGSDIRLVCKEAAMRPVRKVFDALENLADGEDANIKLDAITNSDALTALSKTKPSASGVACKYIEWQKDFESV